MRRRRDPCRPVNIQPDVTILVPRRYLVQAHPDPDSNAARPVMTGKSALRRHAAADGIFRRLKYDEEAVPLSPHLVALAHGKGGTQQDAMSGQRLAIPVVKTA